MLRRYARYTNQSPAALQRVGLYHHHDIILAPVKTVSYKEPVRLFDLMLNVEQNPIIQEFEIQLHRNKKGLMIIAQTFNQNEQ